MSKKKKKNKKQTLYCVGACTDDGIIGVSNSDSNLEAAIHTAAGNYRKVIHELKNEENLDILFLAILPVRHVGKGFHPAEYMDTVKEVIFCGDEPNNPENKDHFLILRGKKCGFIIPIVSMTKMNLATNITIAEDNSVQEEG